MNDVFLTLLVAVLFIAFLEQFFRAAFLFPGALGVTGARAAIQSRVLPGVTAFGVVNPGSVLWMQSVYHRSQSDGSDHYRFDYDPKRWKVELDRTFVKHLNLVVRLLSPNFRSKSVEEIVSECYIETLKRRPPIPKCSEHQRNWMLRRVTCSGVSSIRKERAIKRGGKVEYETLDFYEETLACEDSSDDWDVALAFIEGIESRFGEMSAREKCIYRITVENAPECLSSRELWRIMTFCERRLFFESPPNEPTNAVLSRIKYARRKLRKRIEEIL